MRPEPQIIVNGTALTEGQAMTVRVALSAFIQETDDAMGDEMGRALNRGYAERSAEVFKLMLGPAQSPSQPLVEVQEPVGEVQRIHYGGRARNIGMQKAVLYPRASVMDGTKLYAAPVRGLPLTDIKIEEIALKDEFWSDDTWGNGNAFKWTEFARAIEAAHGISSPAPGGDGEKHE